MTLLDKITYCRMWQQLLKDMSTSKIYELL